MNKEQRDAIWVLRNGLNEIALFLKGRGCTNPAKTIERLARNDVSVLVEALEEVEADRDRWKGRAIRAESDYEKASNHATNLTRHVKAMERALEVEKTCMTCEYVDCDTGDEPCCRCDRGQGVHDCWILDEARFSGGEGAN